MTLTPTQRNALRVLAVWLAAVALTSALSFGAALLIARLQAQDAALDRVFLQGMSSGMQLCGRRD